MFASKSALAIGIVSLGLVFTALPIPIEQTQPERYDSNTLLEFYWKAASGNVDHYDVYLSIDDENYYKVGRTPDAEAPTEKDPYPVPIVAEDGRKYRLKVQGVAANGTTGPMSEPSDPVWCMMSRPGYVKGENPGDVNGDLRVGPEDQEILSKAWGTRRGDDSFDYRADLNFDGSVNILDLVIVGLNWGWFEPNSK